VNKAELIKAVEDRLQSDRKTAQQAVDHVVDVIVRSVAKGEKVAITGFGVFEKRRRGARTARNPKTGAAVKVKATSVPAFRAGSGFKEVVSGAKKLEKLVKSTAGAATKKATPSKSAATRKTAAAKTLAKKSPAKSPAAKTAAAKTLAKKSPAKKTAAKKTAKSAVKKATTAARTAKKAPAKKSS
jgi:DNA-binding protein HU-beta